MTNAGGESSDSEHDDDHNDYYAGQWPLVYDLKFILLNFTESQLSA